MDELQFRLIESKSCNAAMNMAIDHAICESVARSGKPTIRFYQWKPNAVSIGAYQNHNEINNSACKKYKVDVVRRITGGRAVFHSESDFTYSVIAPLKTLGNSINYAYKSICSSIIGSLSSIGIKAELKNKNDIVVGGKKISGNAAKVSEGGVYLQHGTVIYDFDERTAKINSEILNVELKEVRSKVTGIRQQTGAGRGKFYEILKSGFMKGKIINNSELSVSEIKRANELSSAQYKIIEKNIHKNLKYRGSCYVVH